MAMEEIRFWGAQGAYRNKECNEQIPREYHFCTLSHNIILAATPGWIFGFEMIAEDDVVVYIYGKKYTICCHSDILDNIIYRKCTQCLKDLFKHTNSNPKKDSSFFQ